MGPLSLYPVAISALIALPSDRFGPICCHFGPYRCTLWPFRRLSLYPLADSGRFVAISALIALPFGRLGDRPCWGPLSLYPLADSGRFVTISVLIALPFGQIGGSATVWGPLSLYPLAVSALSYVPFVSAKRGAPLSRTLSKFSSSATYPLFLGGVRALETFIFSGGMGPWRPQDLVFSMEK